MLCWIFIVLAHWNNSLLNSYTLSWFWASQTVLLLLNTACLAENTNLGQTKNIISFSGQFPNILMRQGGTFFVVVIISVVSNAVAAYTGNNHVCLRHKRFTDNDRNQQTCGSDWSGPRNDRKRTQFFFSNVKTINAAVKTHTRRCLRS